jgi:hypothetical protein
VKKPEAAGFHGVVIRSADPRAAARAWSRWTGLPARHRGRDYLLGSGPELFVLVRPSGPDGRADSVEELHLAMRQFGSSRRTAERDPMGGESFVLERNHLRLVVRKFCRQPSHSWRRRRRAGR